MNTLTLYHRLPSMLQNSGFGIDPTSLFDGALDRILEKAPFVTTAARNPAADVIEGEKSYLIEVELPGLSEKDLRLELKDGILSLSTTKREEKDETEGKPDMTAWLRRERREYSFARSFLLPEDADGDAIQAKLKDGLLTVEVPKKPETAPRIVPVKVA